MHLRRCADVAEGKDPVGERRKNGKAPVLTPSGAPTFGHCADQHIAAERGRLEEPEASPAMGDDPARIRRAAPRHAGR